MKVTVAICTHDRAELLGRTLESLTDLDVPDTVDWRVLVVQNACSDRTPEVLNHFADRLPLRRIEEPKPGHSRARNRAIEAAEGDYLVWTDDDVQLHRRWLGAYAQAFHEWPEAAFFGGPVVPKFAGRPPRWLREAFGALESIRAAYAARDFGSRSFQIDCRDQLPYGANMALPISVQRRHRYDPALGRRGRDLVGGDELQVLGNLLDEGKKGRWVPRARVAHLIPADRQNLGYIRRYFRDQGRLTDVRADEEDIARLFGRPRWAFRTLVEEELKYRFRRLTDAPTEWLPHLRKASYALGALMGPPDRSDHHD